MKILRVNAPIVTVADEQLQDTVRFYETSLGEQSRLRLRNVSGTLQLVVIGSMLIIAGSHQALAARREMKASYIVDSLEEWREELLRNGGVIIEEPTIGPLSAAGPVGRFMFVRHPDGSLFEYFQPKVE